MLSQFSRLTFGRWKIVTKQIFSKLFADSELSPLGRKKLAPQRVIQRSAWIIPSPNGCIRTPVRAAGSAQRLCCRLKSLSEGLKNRRCNDHSLVSQHQAVSLCYYKQGYNQEAEVLQPSKHLYSSVEDTTVIGQGRGTSMETTALQDLHCGLKI